MAVEAPEYETAPRLQGGGGRWPDLSDVLLAGERVAFLELARVHTNRLPRLPRPGRRWYVLVTDRRLVCLSRSRRAAQQQLHVLLERIESVYQRGLLGGKVVVQTQGGRIRFTGLSRSAGGQLVGLLVAAMRGQRPRGLAPAPSASAGALPAPRPDEALVLRLEELEAHVDRLTQQVRFMEELLHARHE